MESTFSPDSGRHQTSGTAPYASGNSALEVNVGCSERAISTVAGGFVLLYGLSRLSLTTLVAMTAGGALLYRGLTGHCKVYDALRMSTKDDDSISPARRHRQVGEASLAATGEMPNGSLRPST
jgi:Inner membrane protein YgaP-like, transmembrane domain